MTANDPNSLGDSDSDSDESSVPAPTTETRSNSTATTLCAADPPVAGPLVSTSLSEERLWEPLNSSSEYTLEIVCQVMDGRLVEMLRFYATLHWGPNVRGRTNFKRRLDAAQSFEDVVMCSEPVPTGALTEVGRELAQAQAPLKSAEASRTVMENKLFSEQCARANAETWAQQFSADRDAAHKEIKLVKSREASLNVQISAMNAMIKSHQEMYDRLENRMQLALRSNEILTKEVNHDRSDIQEVKLLSHTDSKEITLTSKPRERNRDLVRQVKRLEKANSALSSRLRLEDMDPEALVAVVKGFLFDKIDWETLAPDSQTRCALKAVYKIGLEDGRDHDTLADDIARAKVRFEEIRAEKPRKAEEAAATVCRSWSLFVDRPLRLLKIQVFPHPQARLRALHSRQCHLLRRRRLSITRTGPPVVVMDAGSSTIAAPPPAAHAGPSQSSTVPPVHSPPASTPSAPQVSGGKKGKSKAKRRRTGSDDEGVDFGGGDSGEDAPEEGRECSAVSSSATTSQPQPEKQKASPSASPPTPAEKAQPSSKSSSSKPSVPAPAHHKAGSTPKKTLSRCRGPRFTPKRKVAFRSEFRSSFRLAGGSRFDIKSLTSESSPGQSVKSSSSKSKKSRSKKTNTKANPGCSSSDESVVSVSSESESESSSDQGSSASEGSEAQEDEESELSKLRPKSQCLEDSLDDILDTPAPANPPVKSSQTVEASVKPKSKVTPVAKADSKSSPKGKKKALPQSAGKKKK
ncbi:LOW QUALITY PROTEIN: hypothetical protein PHMEG_00028405 [Phytophthora megakarya]|uniref:Uncharacterized protein n=1 Tax=Phytophthora megakarya TaxID=4795 RepID=A0A225V510_9STRA|nr:LOW QUALITY PROTEIN: hypothetical protein PHMEG_00028405 [Phytophthora megakarya]